MQLTYLIRNAEVRDRFLGKELPDGVTRGAVGTYEAEGGELYILSFSAEGSTIARARTLSKLRRKLQDDANTRVLVDDASLKFSTTLYPRFAEYERKLRLAITLATCAEHDNFDDKRVKSLEELTLEALGRQLFYDPSLQDKVKSRTNNLFTKDEMINFVTRLKEDTVWSQLFDEESLSSVRENYFALCDMRNKVMHHKLITEKDYDRTRKMLRASIDELDAYIEKVRSDMSYPKRHAVRAAGAAKLIWENYESILQNLGGSLGQIAAAANVVRDLSSQFDTSSFASFAAKAAGIQETVNKNRGMWESVTRSMSDQLKAVQTPGLTSAIEAINQQSQLQRLISNEAVSSFANAAAALDTSAFASLALSNVDTSALTRAALPNFDTAVGRLGVSGDDNDPEYNEESSEGDESEE